MEPVILCLNGGSSSLKFAAYHISEAVEELVFSGAVEAIGESGGKIWLRAGEKSLSEKSAAFPDHAAAIKAMFAALQEQGVKDLAAVGHRIVHGGPLFTKPQRIDQKLKGALRELVPFAPLHLPSQIAMIEAVSDHFPDLPQVASFDTAFHSSMPEVAKRFALPRELWEKGIKRYGFHGLSYEFIVGKLGHELGQRAIIAHLGNGSSMVALRDGQPMDTSMGLTPSGGFIMGTRSGDLDPGVLLYLMNKGYSADRLEKLINHQSGMMGVSGQTGDMRVLLEKRPTDSDAALAVKMFCYQVRKFIGAFAAVLGGLDTLVFAGGIGERAAPVRAEICDGLEYLGITLDGSANGRNAELISENASSCAVRVVKTDEDLMIARHTRETLAV
ncbi:MAG TPA: acetate/propionate family kinase [Candidatus Angelobacter sp.]|nr:acetate/propionate family kinase [Candidatus Angelobacter sp.]